MNLEPVTILTAELKELGYHDNRDRTNALRLDLVNEGFSFVGVKVNGLQGFLVTGENVKPLLKLAVKYNQLSIYTSDEKRETHEINCLKPKTKENLGKLMKTTKTVDNNERKLTITFTEDGTEHLFRTEQ